MSLFRRRGLQEDEESNSTNGLLLGDSKYEKVGGINMWLLEIKWFVFECEGHSVWNQPQTSPECCFDAFFVLWWQDIEGANDQELDDLRPHLHRDEAMHMKRARRRKVFPCFLFLLGLVCAVLVFLGMLHVIPRVLFPLSQLMPFAENYSQCRYQWGRVVWVVAKCVAILVWGKFKYVESLDKGQSLSLCSAIISLPRTAQLVGGWVGGWVGARCRGILRGAGRILLFVRFWSSSYTIPDSSLI